MCKSEELAMELETFLATSWWIFTIELFLGMLAGLSYHFSFQRLTTLLVLLAIGFILVVAVFSTAKLPIFGIALICGVVGFCAGHSYGIVRFPR